MDRETFEAALQRDGYQCGTGSTEANKVTPMHVHPFDARVMVTEGQITITIDGVSTTYGPGDWCSVAANTQHAETVGSSGVSYVVGRRAAA